MSRLSVGLVIFQLRQIRSIRRSLRSDARKTLVNAFVMSRLDYCNSLCHGINEWQLKKLQPIQNAAASLVRDTRNTIISLPFLEICIGFQFVKESSSNWRPWSTNKCQHSLCPSYFAQDCILLSATRDRQLHLRWLADGNCLFKEHEL